jgi:hypothetical protein
MKQAKIIALLAVTCGIASPAITAQYHMLRQWPAGVHEGLFDIEPNNIPICRQVLASLNRKPMSRPYSWLSPPEWNAPITVVSWDSITDADRASILIARNLANCDVGVCHDGRGMSDTIGKATLAADIRDKSLRIETAPIVLTLGQTAKTIVRVHYTTPEDASKIDSAAGTFNSEFYEVVQATPLKLAVIENVHLYADVIEIGGKSYFYGYTSRMDDNRFRPLRNEQAMIFVGEPLTDEAGGNIIHTVCELPFH